MRGILSSNPLPSTARLLVGSHLLLLVQAGLVLGSQTPRSLVLLTLIGAVTVTAVLALILAIAGDPATRIPPDGREPHGR